MPSDTARSASPRGRRPGQNGTRQAILAAAGARFARDGYANATVRKIAADAGVDASLIIQLFTSKEELFGAVMSITPDTLARIADAFTGPSTGRGARVTRAFLSVWEGEPAVSDPMLAMLRGAVADGRSTQLSEFIEARLTVEAHPRGEADPATRIRIALAASMLVGVIVGRRLVRVPTLVDADSETLVELLAPAVDAVFASGQR